jgi:hypothetical protein
MVEILLDDPGLVENAADGTACFHACIQMAMRLKKTADVPSFQDMDQMMRRAPGKYAWEYALLSELIRRNFAVKFIQNFDLQKFVEEPEGYLLEFYGQEAGKIQIENSDLDTVVEDAKNFLECASNHRCLEQRTPSLDDVKGLLRQGYLLIPLINQRILQADPGYAAHYIVIFGFSDRGVRIHNPGPPATRASEIDWTLFERAWSSPQESARNLIAIRP